MRFSRRSRPASFFRSSLRPKRVRRCVGKLSLRNRRMAVDTVAVRLVSSDDAPLKCDCSVTLCDRRIQCTVTVEPHASAGRFEPHIRNTRITANCFADESRNVGSQALRTVTNLVVEDYLRVSVVLFLERAVADCPGSRRRGVRPVLRGQRDPRLVA